MFTGQRDGRFCGALAVLSVVLALLTYVMFSPRWRARSMRIAPEAWRLGAGGAQEIRMERMLSMARTGAMIAAIAILSLGVLVTGLLFWLVVRAFGSATSFAVAAMVVTYAAFVRIFSASAVSFRRF